MTIDPVHPGVFRVTAQGHTVTVTAKELRKESRFGAAFLNKTNRTWTPFDDHGLEVDRALKQAGLELG